MAKEQQLNPPLNDTLLRLPSVLAAVGVSRSTWWRWVAEGYAPAPVRIGQRTTCWRASDIQQFIDSARAAVVE